MSTEILSDKWVSRLRESTGLDVIRVWGRASAVFPFVTADHIHGEWNKRTGEWVILKPVFKGALCFESCRQLFSDEVVDGCPR